MLWVTTRILPLAEQKIIIRTMEGKRACYKKIYGEKTAKDSINKLQKCIYHDGIGNEEVWNSQNGKKIL